MAFRKRGKLLLGAQRMQEMELSFNMRLQARLDQPSLPSQSHLHWIVARMSEKKQYLMTQMSCFFVFFIAFKT